MKINLTKEEWFAVLNSLELTVNDLNDEARYEDTELFDGIHAKISDQLYRRETYAERFIREYGELYADQDVRKHCEGKGIESMELTPDKRFVIVRFIGGCEHKVRVEGDSVSAMVYDIGRQAFQL